MARISKPSFHQFGYLRVWNKETKLISFATAAYGPPVERIFRKETQYHAIVSGGDIE
jgi:hypothetical protein